MRSKERTRPPRSGTVAPVVPVPRPRATSGSRSRLQSWTRGTTWSAASTRTTAWGMAWRRLLS